MSQALTVERRQEVALIKLDRPPANAMNLALAEEALRLLNELKSDAAIGAVAIVGTGRYFSAGLDLFEVPTYSAGDQRRMVELINQVFLALYEFPKPLVTGVNGHALGGGLILAITGDLRVGARGDYRWGLPELKAGVPYPVAAVEIVRDALAPGVARKLVLTAEPVGPQEGLAMGLVDELVEPDQLVDRLLTLANGLAKLPVAAYEQSKLQLRRHALVRMREVVERGDDPLLETWLPGAKP